MSDNTSMTLWQELEYRGFFAQCTNAEKLKKQFEEEKIVAYAGVDPTAKSLHVGNLVPLFLLIHLGKHGHTSIVLTGEGTAKIGDPSGKSHSRPMLNQEQLSQNSTAIFAQIEKIMQCCNVKLRMCNNNKWLADILYVDFLRNIGKHFSVNRMLSFDTYKDRLETGLTFLEFNYQLLQAYDFLHLYRTEKCTLQIGGADQWANIISGCDLIRREHRVETFGYTVPLITRSDGSKMGKSESGAIYCNSNMTSVFDFYQYWRNVNDADVLRFLKLFTFLPIEVILRYKNAQGNELNDAKELLAFTVTRLIHGENDAKNAQKAAHAAFYGDNNSGEAQPRYTITTKELESGILFVDLYCNSKLTSSKSEARRLITQGGARIAETLISDVNASLGTEQFEREESKQKGIMLKCGNKKFVMVCVR